MSDQAFIAALNFYSFQPGGSLCKSDVAREDSA